MFSIIQTTYLSIYDLFICYCVGIVYNVSLIVLFLKKGKYNSNYNPWLTYLEFSVSCPFFKDNERKKTFWKNYLMF